ncbi:MAG: hypothetical protein ABR985_14610 [Methanotrichaceae archaeon]|jgi:hypothetical protein
MIDTYGKTATLALIVSEVLGDPNALSRSLMERQIDQGQTQYEVEHADIVTSSTVRAIFDGTIALMSSLLDQERTAEVAEDIAEAVRVMKEVLALWMCSDCNYTDVCQRPFCEGVEEVYDAPFELEYGALTYAERDELARAAKRLDNRIDEKVFKDMLFLTIEEQCCGGCEDALKKLREEHELERTALDQVTVGKCLVRYAQSGLRQGRD